MVVANHFFGCHRISGSTVLSCSELAWAAMSSAWAGQGPLASQLRSCYGGGYPKLWLPQN
jgi:hypothetical protein